MAWARQHALRLQLLRIFHVYGPGEPETRLWPALRRAALAGEDFPMTAGEQVRDFVPVQAVAAQFLRALCFDGVLPGEPQVRHVGSGQAQTLLGFSRHWWAQWGATGQLQPGVVPYRADEIMRLVPELEPEPESATGANAA